LGVDEHPALRTGKREVFNTPPMAGLIRAVKMKSGQPFLRRDALEKAAGEVLPRILAGFSVDDPGVGRETIYRHCQRVG
jgi:sarcosine dehydrogenase